MPEVSGDVGVRHLQIAQRGVAVRAPVDHVLAAVQQAFFVQADEDFADRAGKARVEREALAAPIAGGAEAHHLPLDGVAGLGFPLPDALFELLAAEVAVVDAFLFELAGHHHLGGDAGVIGAGQPEGVVAGHAMPADGDVDFGVLQHMADVQHAGDVRRGDDEREDAAGVFRGGAEDAGVNPPLRPMRFEPLGLVNFLDLHGKYHNIRGGKRAGAGGGKLQLLAIARHCASRTRIKSSGARISWHPRTPALTEMTSQRMAVSSR